MTPVRDLKPRAYEVGRIRLGVYDEVNRHPAKLDTFRLTTPDRRVADAAAELFGGEVRAWQPAAAEGSQWEVLTEAKEMSVLVPPQDLSGGQYRELWSKGGCQRRCDGVSELISGGPCICDAENELQCSLTTHLLVVIPQLPALGTWRLTTHGLNAAHEFPATLQILEAAVGPDHVAAAILGIELRTSVAKGVTRHFSVPVLRIPVALQELASLDGARRYALPNGNSVAAVVDNEPDGEPEAPPVSEPEEEEGAPAVDAGVSNPADTTAASREPSGATHSGDARFVPGSSGAVATAEGAAAPDTSARVFHRSISASETLTRAELVKVIEAHTPGGGA